MASFFKFASVAYPQKYGYAFDSDTTWGRSTETHPYYRQFDTYGDGLTQHSSDWSVTFDHLADYLISLSVAMLANPELIEAASYTFRKSPGDDVLAFAASVIFKDSDKSYDKRRFFSVDLRKIGTRAKQYDKRYKEIYDFHDGSRASIYRLACPDYADRFEAYQVAEAVKTWADSQSKYIPHGDGFPEFFNGEHYQNVALRNALQACRYIAESYDRRRWAESQIENYKAVLERAAARLLAESTGPAESVSVSA